MSKLIKEKTDWGWVLCCIVWSILFGCCMLLLAIIAHAYYLGLWRFTI